MTCLGGTTETKSRIHPETGEVETWKVSSVTFAKCDNDKNGCNNFTTNHDLAGSWCSKECFMQHESYDKIKVTRKELLQLMLNWSWDMDRFERKEVYELRLVKEKIDEVKL